MTLNWHHTLHYPAQCELDALQPRLRHLRRVFAEQLKREKIAASPMLIQRCDDFYLPLAAWLASQQQPAPLIVGINGAQGSGKSTLSRILSLLLEQGFNKRVVTLAIDDLYYPHQQRQQLAQTIHPLLMTRGVPGTHDVALGLSLLNALKNRAPSTLSAPLFDKSIDDRLPRQQWRTLATPVDIVLFEGWCVGARAQHERELRHPINALEETADGDGRWRRHVNQQLAGPYQRLFSQLDLLIMLKVPDMESVLRWRTKQEHQLKHAHAARAQPTSGIMSDRQLARFIMHYERITRATLQEMPQRAHLVVQLNQRQQIDAVTIRKNPGNHSCKHRDSCC